MSEETHDVNSQQLLWDIVPLNLVMCTETDQTCTCNVMRKITGTWRQKNDQVMRNMLPPDELVPNH